MDISSKQYGLFESPNNQRLFSDYYLTQRVKELDEWRNADVTQLYQALRTRWADFGTIASPNESETEDKWIRPVLTALGHHYKTQVSLKTPQGTKAPDYVLFGDPLSLQNFPDGTVNESDFDAALAICEAKKWGRSLDQTSGKEQGLSNNPALQTDFYMRHSGVTWGILTNGRKWRLYHKESSKHLDIFYEVDLAQILESGDEDAFRYFALFFRRDAFGGKSADSQQTIPWLELVLNESRAYEQGVGDNLKEQVYEALRELTQGFLSFQPNGFTAPYSEEVLADIYDNSLIVLYRILFTLYAESRDLLPVSSNLSYASGYSFQALKNRVAHDLNVGVGAVASVDTAWQQLSNLWQIIDQGNAELGVPVYNGGLFNPERHPFLTQYRVGDNHLRNAIDLLARVTDKKSKKRDFVDYRDLAVRHLGSIYEGLLEYKVRVADGPLNVDKVKGKEIYTPADSDLMADIKTGDVYLVTDKGERKSTGSYYTPDYIVQYIVEQTLRPILDEVRNRYTVAASDGELIEDEAGLVQDMLAINVLDPAMGSGHFLVAATDFMAVYMVDLGLTWAEQGDDAKAYWRRRVAQACIYGVDLNKLAVELAKLSMWLTTIAQDRPLSFLDHHLRWGNSLVGARMANVMLDSVPKKRKSRSKKNQPQEGQLSLLGDQDFSASIKGATDSMVRIEALAGETLDEVKEAERIFEEEVRTATRLYRQLADVWTARHFGLELNDDAWIQLLQTKMRASTFSVPTHDRLIADAEAIGEEQRFFHWELEFPEVFFDEEGRLQESAGFDAVIGNPPYVRQEKLKHLKSYFQARFSSFHGSADLYLYFYEQGINALRSNGRLAYISSGTFAKTNSARAFRQWFSQNCQPKSVIDFGENQPFEGAEMVRPSILVVSKSVPISNFQALFMAGTDIISPLDTGILVSGFECDVNLLKNSEWNFQDIKISLTAQKISANNTQLGNYVKGELYNGIKTALNDAFYIDSSTRNHLLSQDKTCSTLIKPMLKGADLRPWYQLSPGRYCIIIPMGWTNKVFGVQENEQSAWEKLQDKHPSIAEHLSNYAESARKRTDQGDYWWELRACNYYEAFGVNKIFWNDITKLPRFSQNDSELFINQKGYIIPEPEPFLLGLLQSRVIWFMISQICTPLRLRGGLWQYQVLSQSVERLPVPSLERIQKQGMASLSESISVYAKERYQLHQQTRHRIQSDLGTSDKPLNQKLTSWWNLDFATFRKEIKKVYKTDIPLAERDEWEDYLTAQQAKHTNFTNEIIRLETELNEIVYGLFDLTPEEIQIIEESTKYKYGEV